MRNLSIAIEKGTSWSIIYSSVSGPSRPEGYSADLKVLFRTLADLVMYIDRAVNPAFTNDESHEYETCDRRSGVNDERAPTATPTCVPIMKYVLVGVIMLLVGVGIGFAAAYAVFKPTCVSSNTTDQSTLSGTSMPTAYPKLPDVFRQCRDIKKKYPSSKSGIYTVYPDTTLESRMEVYCEMNTDGGGWLVFQRRNSGLVDFYRKWENYAAGFGSLQGEFWLGNRHLHTLTCLQGYELRIDLADFDGEKRYAKYKTFQITAESDGFRLIIGNYSGTAGDSFTSHNRLRFSTKDVDHDTNQFSCAQMYKGGWWYGSCHASNLNGQYLRGKHNSNADGVNWKLFRGHKYSLKTTVMSIRTLVL